MNIGEVLYYFLNTLAKLDIKDHTNTLRRWGEFCDRHGRVGMGGR